MARAEELKVRLPPAAVENASRADARLFHGTLADLPALARRDELTGPVMVIIGEAVAGADLSRATPLGVSIPAQSILEELTAVKS